MFDLRSGGPRVHHIDAHCSSRSSSDDPHDSTRHAIKTNRRDIVPHGEKQSKSSSLKGERFIAVRLNPKYWMLICTITILL